MAGILKDLEQRLQELSVKLKDAYNNDKLPSPVKAEVSKLVDAAHANTLTALGKPTDSSASQDAVAPHELALVRTALQGETLGELLKDLEGIAEFLEEEVEKGEFTPPIGPEGEIWWFEKYQQLDVRWLECVIVWLENYDNKVDPFPWPPAVVTIPDQTSIALVGDWGTGHYDYPNPQTPSQQVNAAIAKHNPDYAIHLGDVYYAGTSQEEQKNFLEIWTGGSKGSFALNSNHEMMDGGHGYFDTLLADPRFSLQEGCSVFVLENSHWVIIGLDSSYYSEYLELYGPGKLDPKQLGFLKKTAAAAHLAGKRVMIMSHQNGLSGDGKEIVDPLWSQVTSNLPEGATVYWYWAHQHIGVVYPSQNNIIPRCSGHGGIPIPWGFATGLESGKEAGKISWFEQTKSPDVPYEIMNGFTLLTFNGPNLTEQFFEQTGKQTWPSAE